MMLLPVAKQVAALRKRLRMEQRALEPLTGLKQPHIARIEGGQDVRLSTLEKLVKALGAALVVVPRDRLAEVQALLNAPPGDTRYDQGRDIFDTEAFNPYADIEVRDDD
ncbi:MAG: helix-turn-helix domain-containing protein [Alcanivorax sp.]|jgi:predicted transcriptional regulator|nr:helix-turn-helix domain-containing protein [Alcanivorax sp.]